MFQWLRRAIAVGATLVVARVHRPEAVHYANTGEDKPRPYELFVVRLQRNIFFSFNALSYVPRKGRRYRAR